MIELRQISKSYGGQPVLDGFSHTIGSRGITCLLGASGSGKSTLLNLLAGFDRDYSGQILVDGQDLAGLSPEALCEYRRSTIGFVFQEYHLLPGYTVLENILLAAELGCGDDARNREEAMSVLRRLGIAEKANEKIENLSGGQKQRAAIARALSAEPELILADEPTGALDRSTANEIMELLAQIAQERPVLVITHDEKVCRWADEVITIEDGKCRVCRQAPPERTGKPAVRRRQAPVPVSMVKRGSRNFRVHFRRFLGICLAVTTAVSAVLMSFSSRNIIDEKIAQLEEKNAAFLWGQIPLADGDDEKQVLALLEQSPSIGRYYFQYPVPEAELEFEDKQLRVPGKEFGCSATESVNIGSMPRDSEIAVTPSLARQFTEDIRTLIGKELTFNCGGFSAKLRISGIFSGSFDDYYVDAQSEQRLYDALAQKGAPVSAVYQVAGFDSVPDTAEQLEAAGVCPITASEQVRSLSETFAQLQTLFLVVTLLIVSIALSICGMLLTKLARMRAGEMGLYMALGYRRKQIQQMLLWESLLLSALCVLTTAGMVLVLNGLSGLLPIRISPAQMILCVCAAVVLVCCTTAISNAKLLRTDPAKVLRQ